MKSAQMPAGALKPWNVADLPAPPKFNFRNVIAVVGPGAIALSMSIGSGEWLMGPSAVVRYGTALLWITTVSVFFQIFINQEFARYTFYTGEAVLTGFMRTKPGPKLWGWFYPVLAILQSGWPGWAGASAATLFAVLFGHLPDAKVPADRGSWLLIAYLLFFSCVVLVLFGGRIERTLEKISWGIVIWIVVFLLIVDIGFVPAHAWKESLGGLVKFGSLPQGANWLLLGAFAAYSGAGGMGNCWITNWLRDKGYGMGKVVGFIPSAVGGGKEVKLATVGSAFETTESNLRNWKEWWKYLWVDQGILFGGGCIVGMFLCVLLAYGVVPHGTDITKLGAGAYQAKFLAEKVGHAFWYLTLLNGFWILWGTQLSIVDGFSRLVTDHIWSSSDRIRNIRGGDVRYVYYTILIIFAVWGCIAMNLAQPMFLLIIGANIAGLTFVITGIHILIVNRRFLPKELQAPLWRETIIVLSCIFFGFFTIMSIGRIAKLW